MCTSGLLRIAHNSLSETIINKFISSSSSSRKSFKVRNISLKEHPRHLIDIKTHKIENKNINHLLTSSTPPHLKLKI